MREPTASSRSYASIVVANTFTVFNAILIAFAALTLAFGKPQDALFLGIVVANTVIGIGQEARAKRALDRLAALVAPRATVVRDGVPTAVPAEEVVVGDLVAIAPGDQLVADGELLEARDLRLDESILTGESEPVGREAGDMVDSGAFVVEGGGRYRVSAAGADSRAARIAGQARAFRHPRSPLERSLNRLLLVLVAIMVPLGGLLAATLIVRDTPLRDAVPKATAAIVSLVPEGLILLAGLTMAVAAARMAGRGALAQQLNAIESLASADIVCLDKTGTLTDASVRVVDAVRAPHVGEGELDRALERLTAGAAARNLTLAAIAERWPAAPAPPLHEVPFASRRRWSAVQDVTGTTVLAAPELLAEPALAERVAREQAGGRRVVAVGEAGPLDGVDPDRGPPPGLRPLGVVVLAERLRGDTRETVAYLREEGVELRVLSGDAPATAAAIAADAGIGEGRPPVDGRALPEDPDELRRLLAGTSVIGRISPEGKRRVVEALRDAGHYVAMIGDGVNDVPALKAARLAIAQGSGAQMAKAVADVVLVTGDFSTIPRMVEEGRRILRNVQRVAKLFVTKSAFAALLILTVGTTSTAYPFLPRHLTVASTFGVGIPGFFLALAPSSGRWRSERFLADLAAFAIPGGAALAGGTLVVYLGSLHVLGQSVAASRTVSTTVLLAGLLVLMVLLEGHSRRRRRAVEALALLMAAGYVGVLLWPSPRRFFALVAPTPQIVGLALLGAAVTALLAALGLWLAALLHRPE